MFGLSRSVTLALVGWLWADILLGLFVIFLAAASTPVHAEQNAPAVDPKPLEFTVDADGAALLGDDEAAKAAARDKFLAQVRDELARRSEIRRVAIAFLYGTHADPIEGTKLATEAGKALDAGQFEGAAITALHDIVPGDAGTKVELQIYFYRRT